MTSTRSNSEVLAARMQITCGRLFTTYERLWAHPEIGTLVPDFLVLMHQIVRASVPLMRVAHSTASERAATEPVCRLLVPYLAGHMAEERDHDEWVLQDLETAGLRREDILGKRPGPSVAALVGAQYYWIQHHDPVALLGYMRLLEGNPPSESHIARLQQHSGLPASVFRTYQLHGQLDPDHLRELDEFLDLLPLTESQSYLIWASVSHTAEALATCIDELVIGDRSSRFSPVVR